MCMSSLIAAAQRPHSSHISIAQNFSPLDELTNQQEGTLADQPTGKNTCWSTNRKVHLLINQQEGTLAGNVNNGYQVVNFLTGGHAAYRRYELRMTWE